MTAPSAIDSCNCSALRQATRFVSQMYEKHYAQSGITASQFSILANIHDKGRVGMVELAEAMVMDRTTLVRAVKPLERDGYLVSEAEGQGSRKLMLSLSDNGRRKLAETVRHWEAAQAEFVELVGAERADMLRAFLQAIPAGRGD